MEDLIGRHRGLAIVYRFFTFVAVVLLWVVFRSDDVHVAAGYLSAMFEIGSISQGLSILLMYLWEMKWELLACVLGSFLILPIRLKESRGWQTAVPIAYAVLFFISCCYLVKGQFSPFLYFNF